MSATTRSAASAATRARTQTKRLIALLLLALGGSPGCYLAHLAGGQARLLWARRPIAELLADPATPADVRALLALASEAREFARELGLRVQGQYTSYAAWPGDRLVTALVATRPGEVEPAGFFFPLVGRLPYKGFFDPERARDEASRLQRRGLDVCLVPVAAYSSLGWIDDPVTEPMLRLGAGPLVETLLHELVHATVFVRGEAAFNEGVATFVGQEGAVRLFRTLHGPGSQEAEDERARVADARAVAHELGILREAVERLYGAEPPGPARETARAALEARARTALASLRLGRHDAPRQAEELRLNDACLALAGTYERDLEPYSTLLAALGGDLRAWIAAALEAAETPDPRATLLGEAAAGKRAGPLAAPVASAATAP